MATIWLLLMVLLTPIGGFQSTYVLNKFDTSDECGTEQKRIAEDMAAAYPGDESYRIECREKNTPGIQTSASISAEQMNYTQIITKWAQARHPQEVINFKVMTVKPIQTDNGANGIIAFQVHLFYGEKTDSYVLFIKNDKILGWIYAGEAEADTQEEEQEIFSYKDQT